MIISIVLLGIFAFIISVGTIGTLAQLKMMNKKDLCDLSKDGEEPHDWGKWEKRKDSYLSMRRPCNVCGWIEEKSI